MDWPSIYEYFVKALPLIEYEVVNKVSCDNVTAYRVKNIIRIDIKMDDKRE